MANCFVASKSLLVVMGLGVVTIRLRFEELVRLIEGASAINVEEGTVIINIVNSGPFGKEEQEVLVSKVLAVTSDESPSGGALLPDSRGHSSLQTMTDLQNFFTKCDWAVFGRSSAPTFER